MRVSGCPKKAATTRISEGCAKQFQEFCEETNFELANAGKRRDLTEI